MSLAGSLAVNLTVGALSARWLQLVGQDPGRQALQVGRVGLRRSELESLVVAEQRALAAAGVAARDIVAWLGINTPTALATLMACERLGAVFMPLNWRLAVDELVAIVRHAGVRTVRGTADQRAVYARLRQAMLEDGGVAVRGAAEPGDLLLVYTSGTTGTPKGAMHTAAAVRANAEAAISVQGFDERTRALAVLPIFHVGGLCIQLLPTLLAGGTVCMQPRFDAGAWLADVALWRPDTSLLVPATMRAIVEHPAWRETDVSCLRFINSGSSVVPLDLIEAFHARGVPVAQVYGSTETGPVSIALAPESALLHPGKVGVPAPGVQVRLQREHGGDVADGMVGEIHVRGANVMRGYHRMPEHPDFQQGWFRSGDLARRSADGLFEVVGRCKDMIVSGGENIYPAEIENLVAALPAVAECAVIALPDARWGEVPVLVLCFRPGQSMLMDTVRAAFESRLAHFKHPKRIVVLDALPKTALGKVQKAALVDVVRALG